MNYTSLNRLRAVFILFYAHNTQLGYRFGYVVENMFVFIVKDDEVFRKCIQAIDRTFVS